ncbi:MAG: hypothetical protein PHD67_06210 [Oscillospiraceae bacterium]|nr:hypothetical protein [Oscillospiraceae bacterium]
MDNTLVLLIILLALALVAAAVVAAAVKAIRRKARRLSQELLGTAALAGAAAGLGRILEEGESTPKSLSGCDPIFAPQIREDFPDLNLDRAKGLAEEYLREQLEKKGYDEIQIHQTVVNNYRRFGEEKAITFQTAAAYRAPGEARKTQARFEEVYSYLVKSGAGEAAKVLQCPQCGGALPENGARRCKFCGGLLVHILDATWQFTACRPA